MTRTEIRIDNVFRNKKTGEPFCVKTTEDIEIVAESGDFEPFVIVEDMIFALDFKRDLSPAVYGFYQDTISGVRLMYLQNKLDKWALYEAEKDKDSGSIIKGKLIKNVNYYHELFNAVNDFVQ